MKGKMKNKILIVAFAFVLATGFLTGCEFKGNNTVSTETAEQKVIEYDGVEGKTAFDLLKEKNQVEADQQSFGVMIKSINGLAATDKEFWLYSINDKPADIAADKYTTKPGDKIKWEYKGM